MTEREQHRNWVEEAALGEARREIRRLRRALREIANQTWPNHTMPRIPHLAACNCPRCIATRALKGKP